MKKYASITDLVGKTLTSLKKNDDGDELYFECSDGSAYKMYHEQDCCESVWLEEVVGAELDSLVGEPIMAASVEANREETDNYDSTTWTFYKIATAKENVTLRWCGQSNGYYSEDVDFVQTR